MSPRIAQKSRKIRRNRSLSYAKKRGGRNLDYELARIIFQHNGAYNIPRRCKLYSTASFR